MTEGQVAGTNISRGYTSEEILDMHTSGRLRKIAEAGYVGQGSIDTGLVHFVPFQDSPFFRSDPVNLQEGVTVQLNNSTLVQHPDSIEERRKILEEKHPMLRTSPQQKVARMMLRLMSEVKRTGSITGMSDDDIAMIVGEGWKQGDPITSQEVQRVAQHLMHVGEADNKEADSHRTTRAHPLA